MTLVSLTMTSTPSLFGTIKVISPNLDATWRRGMNGDDSVGINILYLDRVSMFIQAEIRQNTRATLGMTALIGSLDRPRRADTRTIMKRLNAR